MKKLLVLLFVSITLGAMQPIHVPSANVPAAQADWRPVKHAPLGSTKSLVDLEREKAELNKEITELNKKMEAVKGGVRARGEHHMGRKGVEASDPMRMLVMKRDKAERQLREVEKYIAEKRK